MKKKMINLNMKKFTGIFIIIAISIITFNIWLLSKDITQIINDPLRSLSQVFSLLGIVLMSITLLLTTRFSFIENLFGGLDKTYLNHRILGFLSFIFIINHPLLLAIKAFPFIKTYFLPGNNSAYNFGIVGVYFLVFSFLFMTFIKLPYHSWKLTHRFLGLTFLFGSIHALLIPSDINNFLPLKLWVLFFIIIGLISVAYIIFFYYQLGPKYIYKITKIERKLDIVNMYLKPIAKKLIFKPGQFIYTSFRDNNVSRELHPFSLSSSPIENRIRISTKMIGDYTMKLPHLEINSLVYLYGPYGKFGEIYLEKQYPFIWIAGGIGITPFLSMLHSRLFSDKTIYLFYCIGNKEEAIFEEEIKKEVEKNNNLKLNIWYSQNMGRLKAENIIKITDSLSNYFVQICAPSPMTRNLKKQLLEFDIPEERIISEDFQLI